MIHRITSVATIGLMLAACAGPPKQVQPKPGVPETRALANALPPIEAPMIRSLGPIRVLDLLDNREDMLDIKRYGNGIRLSESNGCVSTRAIDWFAPSDSFANCSSSANWHSATASVRQIRSLFPLKPGARGEYHRRAVSVTDRVSERTTRCRVRDTVELVLPSDQTVPAFVVRCDDGRIRRTTWYAPGHGPVAYREVHKKRGVRDAWVRLSI